MPELPESHERVRSRFVRAGVAATLLILFASPVLFGAPPTSSPSESVWLKRAQAWVFHVRHPLRLTAASAQLSAPVPGNSASPDYAQDADIIELYHLRFERVGVSGLSTQVVQRVFQVESEEGARDLGLDDIWYDASRNRFQLWRADIFHDGKLAGRGRDEGRTRPYDSGSQSRRLRFSGLQPGDIVNIIYCLSPRLRSSWTMLAGKYLGDLFAFRSGYPARQVRYVLESCFPLAVSQSRLAPPLTWKRNGLYGWEWQAGALPAFYSENEGPSVTDRSPFVQASSFRSWQALVKWYLNYLRQPSRLAPALRAKWLQLAPPGQAPAATLQRIRAILARRLRYAGDETGPHAFFPDSVASVWRARRGDCKDGALLLATWLRLEGIPADVALLRTRRMGRLAKGAATMAAFDHAIVYVPGRALNEPPLWIDTTAPAFQSTSLPSSDQGALALILRPGQRHLVQVPIAAARVNLTTRRFQLRPNPTGGYELSGSVSVSGADAPSWRARCAHVPGRRQRVQAWLRFAVPEAVVRRLQVKGLSPQAPVFQARFHGWVPDLPTPLDVAWLRTNYVSALAFTERRRQPLKLNLRWRTQDSWSLQLPRACPASLSLPQWSRVTDFGSLRVSVDCQNGRLQVSDTVAQRASSISAVEYPLFRQFWRQVDMVLRRPAWPILPRMAIIRHTNSGQIVFPDLSGSR